MFHRVDVRTAIVVAVLSPAVILRGADEPILKLALQRADMPATTVKPVIQSPRMMDADDVDPYGVRGVQGVQYMYSWPPDKAAKTNSVPMLWEVHGEVYRAPDDASAKRLFNLGKSVGGLTNDSDFRGPKGKDVSLPLYGDEQLARLATDAMGHTQGLLFVRQGTVVWEMMVRGSITFKPDEAEVLDVMRKYGPLQKTRASAK